jgi:hypothetical protein
MPPRASYKTRLAAAYRRHNQLNNEVGAHLGSMKRWFDADQWAQVQALCLLVNERALLRGTITILKELSDD